MLHVTLRSIRHKPEKMISLLPSSNAHVHKVINISVKTNCNTCRLAVHKETRDKAVDCFMPPDVLATKYCSASSKCFTAQCLMVVTTITGRRRRWWWWQWQY